MCWDGTGVTVSVLGHMGYYIGRRDEHPPVALQLIAWHVCRLCICVSDREKICGPERQTRYRGENYVTNVFSAYHHYYYDTITMTDSVCHLYFVLA